LDSSLTLYHFMLTGQQEAQPEQEQQQQEQQQEQQVVQPAAEAADEAHNLLSDFSLPAIPLYDQAHDLIGNWVGELLGPQAGHGGPGYSLLQTQQAQQPTQQQQQGSVLQESPSPAASSLGHRGEGSSPGRDQQQQQQRPQEASASAGRQGRAGSPQAAPQRAQSEGHYSLLTVGGPEPLAGRGQHGGRVLVVQGNMEVEGEVTVHGLPVVSGASLKLRPPPHPEASCPASGRPLTTATNDSLGFNPARTCCPSWSPALTPPTHPPPTPGTTTHSPLADMRVKEEVRLFDEAERAVAIAADISTFIYKYQVWGGGGGGRGGRRRYPHHAGRHSCVYV
jgi:hypothetical protein